MHDSELSQSERLDEELVAYLDGQLDRQSARQVEQRLASEEPVRRRLRELAQSWDLLDQLPHVVADDAFIRSTVEMVAVAAEQEFAEQQAAEPRRRRRRWLWGVAAALGVGIAGYVVAASVWNDPNEKLIRDLSVIENQERYKQAADIDFLKKLNEQGLFSDETPETGTAKDERAAKDDARAVKDEGRGAANLPPTLTGLETPSQRRETLERMTAQEKDDLRVRFDKFNALSADEQERLRRFEEQLNADPSRDRLRRIMTQYHEWLKALSPIERSELLALASTPRIEQIRNLQHAQEAKLGAQGGGPKLLQRDVNALHHWEGDFATKHAAELLAARPSAWPQPQWLPRIDSADPDERRRALVNLARYLWRTGAIGEGKRISPSEDEIQALMKQLSPEARKILDAQLTTQQRIDTIGRWVSLFRAARLFNRQPGEGMPQISQDELNKFFEGLPSKDKEVLLAVPNDDDFNRVLRRMYYRTRPNRAPGPSDAPGGRDKLRPGGKPEIPPPSSERPPASASLK